MIYKTCILFAVFLTLAASVVAAPNDPFDDGHGGLNRALHAEDTPLMQQRLSRPKTAQVQPVQNAIMTSSESDLRGAPSAARAAKLPVSICLKTIEFGGKWHQKPNFSQPGLPFKAISYEMNTWFSEHLRSHVTTCEHSVETVQ
ncbi:hypothetical protein B0H16DRAFT_1472733 [Mycena metata]|uniref:Uncharacterized protein n=1 Tax=Mycena metata TaxID=1033252 RepID=A0AAD7HLY8_9AGAR|nr:hypothetical protein B0H16DRAFT_1472733 [Mycena metata]